MNIKQCNYENVRLKSNYNYYEVRKKNRNTIFFNRISISCGIVHVRMICRISIKSVK